MDWLVAFSAAFATQHYSTLLFAVPRGTLVDGCSEASGRFYGERHPGRADGYQVASAFSFSRSGSRIAVASDSCAAAARKRSASSAAMQPVPAAVTAWR